MFKIQDTLYNALELTRISINNIHINENETNKLSKIIIQIQEIFCTLIRKSNFVLMETLCFRFYRRVYNSGYSNHGNETRHVNSEKDICYTSGSVSTIIYILHRSFCGKHRNQNGSLISHSKLKGIIYLRYEYLLIGFIQ